MQEDTAGSSNRDGQDFHALLTAREAERRHALVEEDWTLFDQIIADDIVHVHTTGIVHDKAALLHHAREFLKFRSIERGILAVRSVGPDAAVMTGEMTNTVSRRGADEQVQVRAFVTQVWVRRDGRWQIASFHAVRLPENS